MLDPKGLEVARKATALQFPGTWMDEMCLTFLRTYLSTTTPAEVGGLWGPANPEHAKLGWSYDFEQTERIARAAYDSTGYDATMEAVEFVMAEADRRHCDALSAKDAELAAVKASNNKWLAKWEHAEAQLAEARKALNYLNDAVAVGLPDQEIARRAKMFVAACALTGGEEDG